MNYDRNLIYFFLGFIVIAIFAFSPETLIRRTTFRPIAFLCALEFAVGVALHFTSEAHRASGALVAPLPTLGYFRLCLKVFLNVVHREPVNVAWNWSPGLFKDRMFAFVFVFGAVAILAVAVLGMEKLANAGW